MNGMNGVRGMNGVNEWGQVRRWLLFESLILFPTMSRPLRIEFPGAWYHVMNRGRRREDIFLQPDDFAAFLKIVRESAERWDVNVAAYCLMSNHYHLLLQTPQGNLARCMRHINGVYTQHFNRSHQQDGQLFRGRYKAVLMNGVKSAVGFCSRV